MEGPGRLWKPMEGKNFQTCQRFSVSAFDSKTPFFKAFQACSKENISVRSELLGHWILALLWMLEVGTGCFSLSATYIRLA